MNSFNNSERKALREEAFAQFDKKVLAERVNTDYPAGIKEIADLLTFLPEESRESAVRAFVRLVLQF